MSRTYRLRKAGYLPWWADYTWKQWVDVKPNEEIDPSWEIRCVQFYSTYTKVQYERKLQGKELKKIKALLFRDKTNSCKEPGNSRFRNLVEERPLRMYNKKELYKWYKYVDYEPIIRSKQEKIVYYT